MSCVCVYVCVYKSYYPIKQNWAQPVGHIKKVGNS